MDCGVYPLPVVKLLGSFLRLNLAGMGDVEEVDEVEAC